MANGETFDPHRLTAASYMYPLGTEVEVTDIASGRSVDVTITDRGPKKRLHRLIDLSEAAAEALGIRHKGVVPVAVKIIGG